MSRDALSLFFPNPKILLVDDDRDFADVSADLIRHAGAEVQTAYDGMAALAATRGFDPDLIISDLTMPILRGDELLAELRKNGSKKPFILLTGLTEIKHVNNAFQYGAFNYLVKPVPSKVLLAVIQRALRSEYQRLQAKTEIELLYHELARADSSRNAAGWKESIHQQAVAAIKESRKSEEAREKTT